MTQMEIGVLSMLQAGENSFSYFLREYLAQKTTATVLQIVLQGRNRQSGHRLKDHQIQDLRDDLHVFRKKSNISNLETKIQDKSVGQQHGRL